MGMSFIGPLLNAHGGLALDKLRPCLFLSPSLLLPPTTTPASPTTLFAFPPFPLHKPLLLPPLNGGPGLLPPENFLRASNARRSVLEQFWLQHGMYITCVFVSGINFLNFVLRVFDI